MSTPHTSILILSRQHWPEGLRRGLQSIVDCTTNPNEIEVLVKISHDAWPQAKQIVNEFKSKLPVNYIVLDGLKKRDAVLDYCNTLLWNTSGTLVWGWGDETRLMTKGWDLIAKQKADQFGNIPWSFVPTLVKGPFLNRAEVGPGCTWYQITTRKLHEVLGRYAYEPRVDSHLDHISGAIRTKLMETSELDRGEFLKRYHWIDIDITEDQHDLHPEELIGFNTTTTELLFTEWLLSISKKNFTCPEADVVNNMLGNHLAKSNYLKGLKVPK